MRTQAIAGFATVALTLAAAGYAVFSSSSEAAPSAADIAAATAPPPPNPEQTFNTECGACHLAYPAAFLPARSWQAITGDLSNHFGEDASLDPDTTKIIADYLVANAADSAFGNPRLLYGIAATDTPLRITETPWWIRRHHEVPASAFLRANIKSKSNCLACHGGGAYSDD